MNIVVAGGSGFLGTILTRSLRIKGNRVFSLSRSIGGHEDDLRCDFTSHAEIEDITIKLSNHKIDVLVNLCSKLMTSVDDGNDVFDSNLKIAYGIINLAKKLLPQKVINASSTAVYPNVTGSFNEKSIVKPSVNSDSLYGLSKFVTENLIDIHLIRLGSVCVHLRICQVYGERMSEDRIIPVLRKELQSNGTMTLWGNGEREIPLIEVGVLTGIVENFIDHSCEGGIYNIVGKHLSLLEIAKEIALQEKIPNHKIILLPKGNQSKFRVTTNKLTNFLNSIN